MGPLRPKEEEEVGGQVGKEMSYEKDMCRGNMEKSKEPSDSESDSEC